MEGTFSYCRVAFGIITISCFCFCFTASFPTVACPLLERNLLLDFKAAIVDENNKLGSWRGFNCCMWSGVGCNIYTGHVSSLDLSGYKLQGNISSFVFKFDQLQHLNLSHNLFNGNFSLHNENLKSLTFLDLSFAGYINEFFVNLESFSNLTSLENLFLDGVNISTSKQWGGAIRYLSNLQQLKMSACGLGGPIPDSLINLTSLLHLNLSGNYLSAKIPAWFENVTSHLISLDLSENDNLGGDLSFIIGQQGPSSSLTTIDLSHTVVKGHIPPAISNISSLESLSLSYTNIEGEIPPSIVNLAKLVHLDLFNNKLTGTIPPSLGSLSSLSYLDLGYNLLNGPFPYTVSNLVNLRTLYLDSINLTGSISFSLFDNLTKLEILDVSFNNLSVSFDSAWIPPFEKLYFLGLGSCNLDTIPSFVVSLYELKHLDLSLNSLTTIPSWIWKLPSLDKLNLSCNQLTGSLPYSLTSRDYLYLDLHNNRLQGALPLPPPGVKAFDLSMNQFNGSIPTEIGEHLQQTQFLSLSKNNLSGAIPDSICTSHMEVLDLSNNMLSTAIPPHLARNCSFLRVLDLAENQLDGKMPVEWGNLKEINTLKLAGNRLRGVISTSIVKCQSLQVLDLGNNNLEGTIPRWIGRLSELHVLILRSNKFHGNIPLQIIDLPNLQILDLSSNRLSGPIPRNLANLLAIVNASQSNPNHLEEHTSEKTVFTVNTVYTNNIAISWKGGHANFVKVLFILKCIDLSNNNLWGSIPVKMGSLQGLITLNLSKNHLSGRIPKTLGGMAQLESLDLSLNRLDGNIPLELQLLSYLQTLNLSYNMLEGKVPLGGQFLTFGESSYFGNPKLSGIPFINRTLCKDSSGYENCSSIEKNGETENSDGEMIGWAVGLGLSYGLGFSIVIGILTLNKRVRKRVFNLYDAVILAIDSFIKGN